MHTLNMKFMGYDEDTQSLLVSFASDATASSAPEDYEPVSFQPSVMWPEVTEVEEIIKRIALHGIGHVAYVAAKEQSVEDATRTEAIKNLVGQDRSYALDELVEPAIDTPFQTV